MTRVPRCPKCAKEGKCRHLGNVPNPGTAYYDAYEFACPQCGYRERSEVYGGDTFMDFCTVCPYCVEDSGKRCIEVLSPGGGGSA